jgi:hypothetical protein
VESRLLHLLRGRWGHFVGTPCRVDLGVLLKDDLGPAIKLFHGGGLTRLPFLRFPILIEAEGTRGLVDTFDVELLAYGAPVDCSHPLDIF